MAYIFQADIYCDRCGEDIRQAIDRPTVQALRLLRQAYDALPDETDNPAEVLAIETLEHAIDRFTFELDSRDTCDSDEYPQYGSDDSETDSPQHCGSGADCLDAIDVDDRKVGYLFGRLTREGYAYAIESIEEKPHDPLMQLWASHFDIRVRFRVVYAAYCGMSDVDEFDSESDAREAIACHLRKMRSRGYPIAVLARGTEWEVLEPEHACLVPDDCGTVSLGCQVSL